MIKTKIEHYRRRNIVFFTFLQSDIYSYQILNRVCDIKKIYIARFTNMTSAIFLFRIHIVEKAKIMDANSSYKIWRSILFNQISGAEYDLTIIKFHVSYFITLYIVLSANKIDYIACSEMGSLNVMCKCT